MNNTYCTSCGTRFPLGDTHTCAKKSTAALKEVRPPSGSVTEDKAPVVDLTASTQASPVDTPKIGRPRIHPDRKAYRAKWQRDKRAELKGKK